MENRRADITEMQLTIDEHHLQILEVSKIIRDTHKLSKENADNIRLQNSIISHHVDNEKAQGVIQKQLVKAVEEIKEIQRDQGEKLTPFVTAHEAAASFAIGVQRTRKTIFWVVGTGAGIYGLIELYKKIFG